MSNACLLSFIQEVTVGEAPLLMTLVFTSAHESLVCVGYKHQFELISESGNVSRIHVIDKQKVYPKFSSKIVQKKCSDNNIEGKITEL